MRHAVGPQPVVRRTEIPFSIDDRRILLVDDVLYTGPDDPLRARRAHRLRPAALDSAHRARRPRPPRAADQGRLRRQEPADLAKQSVQVRLQEIDGEDEVLIDGRGGRMNTALGGRGPRLRSRHLLGIAGPRAGRDPPDARHRRGDAGNRGAADQESADAARAHGRQPVLRAEHAHADVVRGRREASERRHAEHRGGDIERHQGRDRSSIPSATSRRWRPT